MYESKTETLDSKVDYKDYDGWTAQAEELEAAAAYAAAFAAAPISLLIIIAKWAVTNEGYDKLGKD